jgi:hypothetical protein
MSAREFIEVRRTVRGHNADGADPAVTIWPARDPGKLHRQFAFFEGDAGTRRTAQRENDAEQCDAQSDGAEQRPAAKIRRPYEPQNGSFPNPRIRAVAMVPVQRHMILSCCRCEKGNGGYPYRP